MTQLFLNIVFSLQPELNLNVTIQQISTLIQTNIET